MKGISKIVGWVRSLQTRAKNLKLYIILFLGFGFGFGFG